MMMSIPQNRPRVDVKFGGLGKKKSFGLVIDESELRFIYLQLYFLFIFTAGVCVNDRFDRCVARTTGAPPL